MDGWIDLRVDGWGYARQIPLQFQCHVIEILLQSYYSDWVSPPTHSSTTRNSGRGRVVGGQGCGRAGLWEGQGCGRGRVVGGQGCGRGRVVGGQGCGRGRVVGGAGLWEGQGCGRGRVVGEGKVVRGAGTENLLFPWYLC